MDQETKRAFIQTQLARAQRRLMPFVQSGKFFFPRRNIFIVFEKSIEKFLAGSRQDRWLLIPGLSGVGKTTILAQLYAKFKASLSENHILFISLDELALFGMTLQDALDAYQEILGESFESLSSPILLLVDEVHLDAHWASALKVLYGRSYDVYIICTGSSALLLGAQAEDLGRRITVEKLYPLNFAEFQMIKNNIFPEVGLKGELRLALYDSKNAAEAHKRLLKLQPTILKQWTRYDRVEVEKYLRIGTLPFAANESDESKVYQKMDRVIDKIIDHDVSQLESFDGDTLKKFKHLLFQLANGPSISIQTLCDALKVNDRTLQKMIEVLLKAEVLIKAEPYKAPKKSPKYLFMCPLIRKTLLDIVGSAATEGVRRGYILEDVLALHLYREFIARKGGKLSYDSMEGGADFILDLSTPRRIAIEIGAGKKDASQTEKTMAEGKFDYGIVFSNTPLGIIGNTVMVPLDYFWLL